MHARSFFDLYAQGFLRAGLAVPRVHLGDPARNADEILRLWREGAENGAALVVFPELALSGYALDDLHQQEALLDAVLAGLSQLVEASRSSSTLLAVGAPLRLFGRLYNCAVLISRGEILGVAPKSYLPDYREFYEKRQFTSGRELPDDECELLGRTVPVGTDLVFECAEIEDFRVHLEVCEDVWVPIPPSTLAALNGATVLVNLSASNVTIGKDAYRHALCAGQSAKCLAAYLYTAAGAGESTTDLAWDGQALAYENGELLAESRRFAEESQVAYADVDLDRLVQDRMRTTSFGDCASEHAFHVCRRVGFHFEPPQAPVTLERRIERHPFVPADPAKRDERCSEAYRIQVSGLTQRMRSTGLEKLVIGISGGLDSTHALMVAAQAMDQLGLPRANLLAYTMPGFATSEDTLSNATELMAALGVSGETIDIRPSCEQMFRDIGHPFAEGEEQYDIAFENVQAGERTSHLFRLANLHGGMVVGTGDLSELALGWCTYGVGDHMSHYNPNASVPKTLIRYLVEWEASRPETDARTSKVLRDILATEISPELVPGAGDGGPSQKTEEIIGPYDLHDFSLYYVSRRGYRPSKVAFLCAHAWETARAAGEVDEPYDLSDVLRWLEVFLDRFFRTSQFKRSALPNGPKVGSGGSLSPRSDWRAPSDASSAPWLAELARARDWIARS